VRLLLLSNSRCEGLEYLEHARAELRDFLGSAVKRVLFVPYAGVTRTWDHYHAQVAEVFTAIGYEVDVIHRFQEPGAAVAAAEAIVVGGGNTWQLARELHARDLIEPLRERVAAGAPYAGWSAGANVACPTIQTTNDMPICDPLGFDGLGLVPFQINPHYLHGNPPGFKGETREERINEYLALNPAVHVVGLREGTMLRVEDRSIALLGTAPCRVFCAGREPRELGPKDDFSFLLERSRQKDERATRRPSCGHRKG
jgi:dipeptidase E